MKNIPDKRDRGNCEMSKKKLQTDLDSIKLNDIQSSWVAHSCAEIEKALDDYLIK